MRVPCLLPGVSPRVCTYEKRFATVVGMPGTNGLPETRVCHVPVRIVILFSARVVPLSLNTRAVFEEHRSSDNANTSAGFGKRCIKLHFISVGGLRKRKKKAEKGTKKEPNNE